MKYVSEASAYETLFYPNFTSLVSIFMPEPDQSTSLSGDQKSDVVAPIIKDESGTRGSVQAEKSGESREPQLNTQPVEGTTTSEAPTSSTELQSPASPVMDLESDFPPGATSWNFS